MNANIKVVFDADNFGVSFPQYIDVRLTLLAAVFLIVRVPFLIVYSN